MEKRAGNRMKGICEPARAKRGRFSETLAILWSMRKSYPLLFAGAAFMLMFSASLITSVGAFFLGMAFLSSLSGYLNYMKMKRRMERAERLAVRASCESCESIRIKDEERKAA